MVSLVSVQSRFEVPFTVIENGTGIVKGVVGEAEQNSQPSYVFSPPRLVLRTKVDSLVRPGLVLLSPAGHRYIVGYNGPSENIRGALWNSFRLFNATNYVLWQRRSKIIDPVTRLEQDSGLAVVGYAWVAIEPIDRETLDRKVHGSFESSRYIAAARIMADDVLDGRTVTRAEDQLGLRIGTMV